MRIHTDTIHRPELYEALHEVSPRLELESSEHGSRKRTRAFEVHLIWGGDKVKGDGRCLQNTGKWGAGSECSATWDEWGEWIARLFKIDPDAIIGQYDGYEDFLAQTRKAKEWASRGKAKAPWLD